MKLNFRKLTKAFACITVAACVLLVCSCDGKSSPQAAYGVNTSAKLSMKSMAMADSVSFDNAEYAMEEEAPMAPALRQAQGPQESQEEVFERKLIRTGNVSIEVQSVSDAEEKIAQWAKSLGGYVTNANTWEMGAGFTVRVPSDRFDEAMADAGNFGRITNRSVNSQDVSDNYYDIKSRLETKYILRDKLTNYLSQAKDIKDLLEIERQLNSVIEDIESTESRFKRLSNQIDYSTIYIDMHFEHGKNESGIILPDVKESWNTFISNIIAFFWGLLRILFYIVIFGIPVVAVAAFFFWLLFGKVGLLVKLFKKLKK
jgi:hypothetical protein